MIEALKRALPKKKFYSCGKICHNMKKITLEKVKESLEGLKHKVEVPGDIMIKSKKSYR